MVSSGGGDPPCTSSGVVSCGTIGVCAAPGLRGGLRLAALERVADGSRFAAVRRLALVRRLVAVRRLAVVRRFAVVRLFTCARFFRAEREVAARFLRFAICRLPGGAGTLSKKIFSQRGAPKRHNGHQTRVTGTHFAGWTNNLASSATIGSSASSSCLVLTHLSHSNAPIRCDALGMRRLGRSLGNVPQQPEERRPSEPLRHSAPVTLVVSTPSDRSNRPESVGLLSRTLRVVDAEAEALFVVELEHCARRTGFRNTPATRVSVLKRNFR